MVGGAGRRRVGRGSASPLRGPAKSSMWPNVGATHWVALGHSCQTRSFTAGTNKSRGMVIHANAGTNKSRGMASRGGRRGAPPVGRGGASPPRSGQKLHVSQRRGDPLGRPRSFMPTRSFMAGTNKSRGMASRGGRRRAPPGRARRASPPRSGQKLHVAQRRGDPLGRPRSFMRTRSFMAGTNKSRCMASERWAAQGAAG